MKFGLTLFASMATSALVFGRDLQRRENPTRPQSPPCNTGIRPGDTAKFTGVMTPQGWWFASDSHPAGTAQIWVDSIGRLQYAESWQRDSVTYLMSGSVEFGLTGLPRSIVTSRRHNGVQVVAERVEQQGDSVVMIRDVASRDPTSVAGFRRTEGARAGVMRLPLGRAAMLRTLILQCALTRGEQTVRSADGGVLRVRELATVNFPLRDRSAPATLYVLSSDSVAQMAAVWLHPVTHRLIAYRNAEGVMDLIAEGWEGNLEAIGTAEGQASRVPGEPETCAGGGGVGGCERDIVTLNEACKVKVKSLTPRPQNRGGTFALSDSGFTITSDGQGPYRSGSANVLVLSGGVSNLLSLRETPTGPTRSFTVDLSRPVPGDVGVPLGSIRVDAARRRPFVPAATSYSLEIAAAWFNADTTAFTGDIPVGTTVRSGLFINFYVNGLLHVLTFATPGQAGLCGTFGAEALYGEGTTLALFSRPSATSWVVTLPPGSVGRLFDSSRGEQNAVNRGLYYVSMRAVWQQ